MARFKARGEFRLEFNLLHEIKLQIEGDISSKTKCKKLLSTVYVNIFDYVDFEKEELQNFVFKSKAELRKRCKNRGYFPKKEAKASLLKFLLKILYS